MPESHERMALTEAVFYILLTLKKPLHGYGIMQKVSEMSGDSVQLGSGTLYGAINTLLNKGWIKIHRQEGTSRKKKEYIITDEGLHIAHQELRRLQHLTTLGEDILGGKDND
ncbi:PadR family transcriptional regulator [Vallitalea pronyensis]|uniref:PadR family transcriptional regulator n=1 Tax=Vallitalea pronyensis TaxID=1348613 RepID=A0A8J8MGC0_9FIRM|nr:PadR family transcriptional regulator [Vallitalea pronyensis]QUI20992.1 PadR family transcriptional regulator [Vallitalea pronyensis]